MNGALSDASLSPLAVVVVFALDTPELVACAATVVVTNVVDSLLPEVEESEEEDPCVDVSIFVVSMVVVWPIESVVVYVLTELDIDTDVIVEPTPETVVVRHSVTG